MSIQRYEPDLASIGDLVVADLREHPQGRYMTHDDHAAAMAAKDAEIERLRIDIENHQRVRANHVDANKAAQAECEKLRQALRELDEVICRTFWSSRDGVTMCDGNPAIDGDMPELLAIAIMAARRVIESEGTSDEQ